MAPVIVEFERKSHLCTLLMTGQHLETIQDLIQEFGIKSKQVFALEQGSTQEHSTVKSLLSWFPKAYLGVLKQLNRLSHSPDSTEILVHGDTASTVLGALAARQFGGRVIHLESGLTSGKLWNPFPEEILRRIVFRLTDVAMCPNAQTALHIKTHYKKCQVHNTNGNTILDAVSIISPNETSCANNIYFVASLHRFQNIYKPKRLNHLVDIITKISEKYPIYFVLHPATLKRLTSSGHLPRLEKITNIKLTPRLSYGDFLRLAAGSSCVLTDGGSNQEELAALGKPTVIMRTVTERIDGIGKNAIMEENIHEGVVKFLLSHEHLKLQRAPDKISAGPSKIIENILSR